MNNSSMNVAGTALSFVQFKTQALQSILTVNSSHDWLSAQSTDRTLFESFFSEAKSNEAFTSTTPTALDVSLPFYQPGQNVMTVINRLDVSFKAQFSELSVLKNTLANEKGVTQQLLEINLQTSVSEIKSAVKAFVESYNADVTRFTPDVSQGGILEGSQEATRARFATQRDINNPLIGAQGGLRGGMNALGIAIDPQTGLATLDEGQLDKTLLCDKTADVNTIVDFAKSFTATIENLNAAGNPQDRQLDNLSRAIHWIDNNRDAVQQEFGAGKAATPNKIFAKAAAAYQFFAQQ